MRDSTASLATAPALGGGQAAFYARSNIVPLPLIERASGIYLWDHEGRRYIDVSSGPVVSNIGHGNTAVAEAMAKGPLIARGNGRSYGDSALSEGQVLDMTAFRRALSLSPGNEQYLYWGSEGRDTPGSRNVMGLASPAVDGLIGTMLSVTSSEDFTAAAQL